MTLFHDTGCRLGEGPLWQGDTLWFFDILAQRLHALSAAGRAHRTWTLDRMASAAAALEDGGLLVATETALCRFRAEDGTCEDLHPLEAENSATRSNDGRADRHGGFWIGTMGKTAQPGAGALYRYHAGTLTVLRRGLSIPNAIAFAPDGRTAYFACSAAGQIWRWPLDAAGWPIGEPLPHFALPPGEGAPDGAVMAADGTLWCAIWDGGAVIGIDPEGRVAARLPLPVPRPTCPAFGPDGALYITSAREGLSPAALAAAPSSGGVFRLSPNTPALPEPRLPAP
ncbi:MAG: SMP-30/gluconolactonase/LRE family protein [Pseudomonadota bacterium]